MIRWRAVRQRERSRVVVAPGAVVIATRCALRTRGNIDAIDSRRWPLAITHRASSLDETEAETVLRMAVIFGAALATEYSAVIGTHIMVSERTADFEPIQVRGEIGLDQAHMSVNVPLSLSGIRRRHARRRLLSARARTSGPSPACAPLLAPATYNAAAGRQRTRTVVCGRIRSGRADD